jgi:hypothetical protein
MAIFKAVVHSDYAQIPNETAQDESLSFEARGLLTMLLSMPPHWEVHKSWVVDKSPAGKDKVNSIFKELTDAGYIRREEGQRKFGKFAADDYFVFATKPTVADLPSRSDRSGSTGDGQPATRKETALENKHKENKHSSVPPAGGTCESCFGRGYHGVITAPMNCGICNGTGKTPMITDDIGCGMVRTYPDQPTPKQDKAEKPKRKTKAEKLFDLVRSKQFVLSNASDDVLLEWCRLRARKGASDSDLVHNRIDAQLQILINHGMTIDDALTEQVARNWTDLKAEWFDVVKISGQQNAQPYNPNSDFRDSMDNTY